MTSISASTARAEMTVPTGVAPSGKPRPAHDTSGLDVQPANQERTVPPGVVPGTAITSASTAAGSTPGSPITPSPKDPLSGTLNGTGLSCPLLPKPPPMPPQHSRSHRASQNGVRGRSQNGACSPGGAPVSPSAASAAASVANSLFAAPAKASPAPHQEQQEEVPPPIVATGSAPLRQEQQQQEEQQQQGAQPCTQLRAKGGRQRTEEDIEKALIEESDEREGDEGDEEEGEEERLLVQLTKKQQGLGLEGLAAKMVQSMHEVQAATRKAYVDAIRASLARVPGAPPADSLLLHAAGTCPEDEIRGSWPPGGADCSLQRQASNRTSHVFEVVGTTARARVIDTQALRAAFLAHCNATNVKIDKMHLAPDPPALTAQQWVGLCRGLQLVEPEGPLAPILLGIIFSTHKSDDDVGLSYRGFLDALVALALESGSNVAGVIEDQWNADAQEAVKLQRLASMYRRGSHSSPGFADLCPSPLGGGASPGGTNTMCRASSCGRGIAGFVAEPLLSPGSPPRSVRQPSHSRFREDHSGLRMSPSSLLADTEDPAALVSPSGQAPHSSVPVPQLPGAPLMLQPRVSLTGGVFRPQSAASAMAKRRFTSESGLAPMPASPPISSGSLGNWGMTSPVMRGRSVSMGRWDTVTAAASAAVAAATAAAAHMGNAAASGIAGAVAGGLGGGITPEASSSCDGSTHSGTAFAPDGSGKEWAAHPSRFARLPSKGSQQLGADKAARVQEYMEWVQRRRSDSGSRSSSEF